MNRYMHSDYYPSSHVNNFIEKTSLKQEKFIDAKQIITEGPLEVFKGQIRGMKLISNCLCFGPSPEATDEIEQHLSIYSDGRIFFSGYAFGDRDDINYHKNRSKQFKIPLIDATYLLCHVAMYFSKDVPVNLATDVGSWDLELINTDGQSFKYHGSLIHDLNTDEIGLSFLIRKYLRMQDLFVFDGEARFPINKEDDEYIFVNVSCDRGGKTYCYLCDDDLIQDGDEVIVPVDNDGELKTVIVESVELYTAESAPFPVDKCKKVVRRV